MSIWAEFESRLSSVCDDPRRELAIFTETVLELPSDRFLLLSLMGNLPEPTQEQENRLSDLVSRRCAGEPLQYLVGVADFYGRRFSVAPGVLIPRFDTEILIDTALPYVTEDSRVLDLCAGSGCIGLTVGAETNCHVTLVEKFDGAFSLLQKNTAKIYPSANLMQEDIFTLSLQDQYDMILSNPPYIPTEDIDGLSREVKQEPITALDGGDDGLDFYRAIISRFSPNLKSGGRMLFECGIGQADALEQLLCSAGFTDPVRIRDYGGIERVVGAKKKKEEPYV